MTIPHDRYIVGWYSPKYGAKLKMYECPDVKDTYEAAHEYGKHCVRVWGGAYEVFRSLGVGCGN